MHAIRASARHTRALQATAELLSKLRVDALFVGYVARAAWLGNEVTDGPIDVLALMAGPQRNQLAMMASNRGFRVDRDELEACDELDLVPLHFLDEEGEVRIHVLLASNALYARMVNAGVEATIGDQTVRIPRPEDLALMLLMAEDDGTVQSLAALPEFDREAFSERLVSIGLGGVVGR